MPKKMEVRSPALLPNILLLASDKGRRSVMVGRVMVHQFRKSISIECGPSDAPLAALLFYPKSGELFEMCGLFSEEAAGSLTAIVRIGQLTVRRLAETTGSKIDCFVLPGKSPGFRLATMLGFSAIAEEKRAVKMRFISGVNIETRDHRQVAGDRKRQAGYQLGRCCS